MSSHLVILGRQPALGRAELESLCGSGSITRFGDGAVLLAGDYDADFFGRLGGAMKLARVLTTLDTVDWQNIDGFVRRQLPGLLDNLPAEGKLHLGLSAYNTNIPAKRLTANGLELKKALRTTTRSVRLVPLTQGTALSSAQVLHNHLVRENGCEIVIYQAGGQTIIARTVAEQDINSYTIRDRGRPKRDARVGMLPPKLAQIIINLAVGPDTGPTAAKDSGQIKVLDPFCGTGVILQEALLMGHQAAGSDKDPRMVDYTRQNLAWLQTKFNLAGAADTPIYQGDATSFNWPETIDAVACETYLGRPFTNQPGDEILVRTVSECNLIIKKFLKNIYGQLTPGARLCLAVPAWQTQPGRFKHLPLIDSLESLGYNRLSFEHIRDDGLLYYREGQIVARELLVITRK